MSPLLQGATVGTAIAVLVVIWWPKAFWWTVAATTGAGIEGRRDRSDAASDLGKPVRNPPRPRSLVAEPLPSRGSGSHRFRARGSCGHGGSGHSWVARVVAAHLDFNL